MSTSAAARRRRRGLISRCYAGAGELLTETVPSSRGEITPKRRSILSPLPPINVGDGSGLAGRVHREVGARSVLTVDHHDTEVIGGRIHEKGRTAAKRNLVDPRVGIEHEERRIRHPKAD